MSETAEASELKRLRERLAASEQHVAALNQELDQLSYSVSHDLRAPLRAVNGFSTILLEDYHEKLDDEGRHYLKVIYDNSVKMNDYIDAMLALSRLGRRPLNRAEVDVNAMVAMVTREMAAAAREKVIRFEVDVLPPAMADREMLREILVELIGNAIKFSRNRPESQIQIRGEADATESRYYISDNGAGFDMQQAEKLFGLFQKLHRVEDYEGIGAGLAKVRRIVDRHGGQARGEGRVDAGATFFFSLPAGDMTEGT